MQLLVVALRSPFEGHAGNALILRNHLERLSRRHVIDFVAVGSPDRAAHPDLGAWCRRVVMVPPVSRLRRRFAQIAGFGQQRPLRVAAHANPAMQALVERMLAANHYDALLVQLCEAAQFVPSHHGLPSVLDFEDPPALKLERTRPWVPVRQAATATIDLPPMRDYEAGCAEAFDRLVFVSARDAQAFGDAHGCLHKVARVHHAVAVGPEPRPLAARVADQIIVNGNMAHLPNVAAVDFICRSVFPLIRHARPSAMLKIVGANPTAAVRAWSRVAGITVTGTVEDIRTHLSEAVVALCGVPVMLGAQTKVLEAMACGTPVVTTSAGNYGIDAVDGRQLHVADAPVLFASRVVDLLRGEGWPRMSAEGYALVRDGFSADSATAAFERVIEEAVAAHAAGGRNEWHA